MWPLASPSDGEAPRWRTEPDIVLDFGALGIIIVEAKLFSPNETKPPDYRGWRTYLDGASFRDPDCARKTGRYELVRNWRLGVELAEERPFSLVNLAPVFTAMERRTLAHLRIAFGTSSTRRFALRNWASLMSGVAVPDWFKAYAARRRGESVDCQSISIRRSDGSETESAGNDLAPQKAWFPTTSPRPWTTRSSRTG